MSCAGRSDMQQNQCMQIKRNFAGITSVGNEHGERKSLEECWGMGRHGGKIKTRGKKSGHLRWPHQHKRWAKRRSKGRKQSNWISVWSPWHSLRSGAKFLACQKGISLPGIQMTFRKEGMGPNVTWPGQGAITGVAYIASATQTSSTSLKEK